MTTLEKYLEHANRVTGYRRNLARADKLVGDSSTLLGSQALAQHARSEPVAIDWGIGSAAGLVAGGIIGAKHGHWVLGAISGCSIGTNAPALLNAATRNEAVWNLAQTHAGVFASAAMKTNSALGFVIGFLAVGAARYYYGEGR
ncbi:MAG: hypothetical protein V4550_18425 [Gemmatimonadota bacterium]